MDDNESIAPEEMGNSGESEIKSKSNGVCHVEDGNDKLLEGMGSSSPNVTKRPGLRKWRRIPRELAKNPGSNIDSRKNGHLTATNVIDGDSGLGDQHVLETRADSTDSEEQSSRPSSAPRTRPKISSSNGISVNSGDQQQNGRSGTSKKARGVKIEKENSHSNMGSDSRSSNFVFVQGANSVSKGRHSGGSAKYDEDYSDDAHFADKHLNNDAGSEDVSQEDSDVKEEKIKKHEGEQAALVESITRFDFAVEELEREVQKWKDIGKDEPLIFDDSFSDILDDSRTELEDIWKEKIQAELEILAITTTTKTLIAGHLHEMKLNLQQKQEPSQETQTVMKLETEEDVKKMQYRMFRLSSCLVIQLILFVTLYLELSSQNVGLVPT